jgi:hypothetical protein
MKNVTICWTDPFPIDLHDALNEIFAGFTKPHTAAQMNAKTAFYARNFERWSSIMFSSDSPKQL